LLQRALGRFDFIAGGGNAGIFSSASACAAGKLNSGCSSATVRAGDGVATENCAAAGLASRHANPSQ